MSTGQKREPTKGDARKQDEALDIAIKDRVLEALGEPTIRYDVRVRRLWSEHYRVNVVIGEDAMNGKIVHSYFLVCDGAGNILDSCPSLIRRY